jgi:hypothetical protein
MTATWALPRRSSSGRSVRPIEAAAPITGKNEADTAATGIVAGSPSRRMRLQFVDPTAARFWNPCAVVCHERNVGYEISPIGPAATRSRDQMTAIRSGRVIGDAWTRTLSMTVNTAALAPIARANVLTTATAKPGA